MKPYPLFFSTIFYLAHCCLAVGLAAQNLPWDIGFKGGISSVSLSRLAEGESRLGQIGYQATLMARSERFPVLGLYFQPELSFSQKGGRYQNELIERQLSIQTIDIAVLMGIALADNALHFRLGPSFQLLTAARERIDVKTGLPGRNAPADGAAQRFLALHIGTGVEYGRFMLDLSYEIPVIDFFDYTSAYRPRALRVSFGYRFGHLLFR
ncbi:outer membrane beta-barrel protein [Eisenibacter elegans]|jgi:hypothetical protein|uniref:outer membrane beta-barrel protein n=1 Tax=Eisenibacter elegans TaxID=997 RepID=UPI00047E60C4|nr:outer membrane beta-barrel protein [Eisenibacter elegans]